MLCLVNEKFNVLYHIVLVLIWFVQFWMWTVIMTVKALQQIENHYGEGENRLVNVVGRVSSLALSSMISKIRSNLTE